MNEFMFYNILESIFRMENKGVNQQYIDQSKIKASQKEDECRFKRNYLNYKNNASSDQDQEFIQSRPRMIVLKNIQKELRKKIEIASLSTILIHKIKSEVSNRKSQIPLKSIIQEVIQSRIFNFQQNKNFLKSLFKTDQESINQGGNYKSLFQTDQESINQGSNYKSHKVVTINFCPTRVVTSRVFSFIMNQEYEKFLTGLKNIGKSTSIILFKLLSQKIQELKMFIRQNKLQVQLMKDELKQVDFSIPKIMYWNMEMGNDQKKVKQQFKEYFKQLKDIQMINNGCFSNYSYNKSQMIKYNKSQMIKYNKSQMIKYNKSQMIKYNKSQMIKYNEAMVIRTLLVMDHFQVMYQLQQQYQSPQNSKMSIKRSKFKQQYNEQELYTRIKILHKYKTKFANTMVIASYNPPIKFFKQYFPKYRYSHKARISFTQSLHLNSTIVDLGQLALILIQDQLILQSKNSHQSIKNTFKQTKTTFKQTKTTFKQQEISKINKQVEQNKKQIKELLSQVRKQFISVRTQYNISVIIPSIIISTIKQKIQQFTQKDISFTNYLTQLYKNNQLPQQLKKIGQFMERQSIKQINKQINDFIQCHTGKSKKQLIFARLLIEANKISKIYLKQQIDNNKKYLIKIQDLKDIITLPQLEDLLNINIFQYTIQGCINCYLSPTSISKIFDSRNHPDILQIIIRAHEPILKHIRGSSLGCFVESLFIDILLIKDCNMKYVLRSQKTSNLKFKFKNNNANPLGFKPIPKSNEKQYQNFHFLQSFLTSIQKSIIQQNYTRQLVKQQHPKKQLAKNFLFLPKLTNFQNYAEFDVEQIHSTSKLVDFVIINKFDNRLILQVFDITISNDKFLSKSLKFIHEFLRFRDHHQNVDNKIELSYIVLTPQKMKANNNYKERFSHSFPQLQFIQHTNYFEVKSRDINIEYIIKNVCQISFNQQVSFTNKTKTQDNMTLDLNLKLLKKCIND